MYIELIPAYGRDYKSAKAARADWKANKDFVICCFGHPYDGKPINKSQADDTTDKYLLRFNNKTKVAQA